MTAKTEAITSLQQELDAVARQLEAALPPEASQTIDWGIAQVIAAGVSAHALGVGARAPDFTLPAVTGEPVALSAALARGPVVLTFYRGGWCPYCDVQLRQYQRALPEFASYGATLIAVSPQTPDHSVQTATQKALSFPVVSDVGNVVARQYGLVYRVEPRVVDTLRAIGIDLAAINGDGSGELPLTATFVIDPAGVVRWATVDADFRRRPDAAEIVAALAALPTGAVR